MFNKIVSIIIGSLLISYGINQFFVPHHVLDGGMIGLALIVHYVWDFEIGITILMLSIPIYVYAWKYYRSFFYHSIPGVIVSSLFIDWFDFLVIPLDWNPLISSVIGGLILGIGVGMMFRQSISTGGLDLLAQMIAKATKTNVGVMVFIVDLVVVLPGIWVISLNEVILSVIAVTATGLATILVTYDQTSPHH